MKQLLMIIGAICLAATTVCAADWNFYGSARVETFITDTDDPLAGDTNNFSQSLQGNSRIGARVNAGDSLSARFEYGSVGGNASMRLL